MNKKKLKKNENLQVSHRNKEGRNFLFMEIGRKQWNVRRKTEFDLLKNTNFSFSSETEQKKEEQENLVRWGLSAKNTNIINLK